MRVQNAGSYLQITEENMPEIYHCLREASEMLDIGEVPDFFVDWGHSVNAYTSGVEKPFINIISGCIDLLDRKELMFVLGHELGHIKSGHILYHIMADFFPTIVDNLSQITFGIAGIAGTGIQAALYEWYRIAEFTADRAGFLACQDREAGMRTLIKLAGLPLKYKNANFEKSFMKQARAFEELDEETITKSVKLLTTFDQSHPWTVMRGSEYLKWHDSGEYDAIMNRNRQKLYCSKCGNENISTDRFCSNCGFNIQGN